MTLRQQSKFA